METVAVTLEEGGEWIPFVKWRRPESSKGNLIHSIRFSNGSEWDAHNGWREAAKASGESK